MKSLTELISLRRSEEALFVLRVVGKLLTAGTAVWHGAGTCTQRWLGRRGLLEVGVGWQQILLVLEGKMPCPCAEPFNTGEDMVVWLVQ